MKEYALFWKRTFHFNGVSTRREYWIPALINAAIYMVLALLGIFVLGLYDDVFNLGDAYAFIILVSSISLSVRRLHDIGRSGWWVLISLVPILGLIVMLVFECTDSTREATEWKLRDMAAGYTVKYPVETAVNSESEVSDSDASESLSEEVPE